MNFTFETKNDATIDVDGVVGPGYDDADMPVIDALKNAKEILDNAEKTMDDAWKLWKQTDDYEDEDRYFAAKDAYDEAHDNYITEYAYVYSD